MQKTLTEKLSFVLMVKLLEVVRDSGANQREARAALNAAEAMLSDLDLEPASLVIET
jgi:hypothetical protein